MADDLDLERGDPDAAEKILAAGTESRAKRTAGRPKGSTNKAKTTAATEADDKSLYGRLVGAFHDLSESARVRQDDELADILENRKEPMAQGLVSLTRNLRILRGPLVLLINFLEPTLAFWELGSLATRRYIERRQRILWEHQQRQQGVTEEVPVAG
jgi:hypothetical protein